VQHITLFHHSITPLQQPIEGTRTDSIDDQQMTREDIDGDGET